MGEILHERFQPYVAPETGVEPTYQGGRTLLDQFTALERVREKKGEKIITIKEVVAALHKDIREVEKMEEANPHFKTWVKLARLNNEFSRFLEQSASSENPDLAASALKTRRNFMAEHEDASITLTGIVGEMHAKKLLESQAGYEVAHAHPALDVVAGIDLLLYAPSPESGKEGAYYAIQVKTVSYLAKPKAEIITNEVINIAPKETQKSIERCAQAVGIINKHSVHMYHPLMLSLPSYAKLLQEELMDNRTLAPKQELLDSWARLVIPLPVKK